MDPKHKKIILELLNDSRIANLSDWECDFILSIADVEDQLTKKQADKLVEIYNLYD